MCFIERANELLRKSAETALTDMIHLLFSRLHLFPTIESMKKPNSKISHTQPPQTPHIVFEAPTPPPQPPPPPSKISEEEKEVTVDPLAAKLPNSGEEVEGAEGTKESLAETEVFEGEEALEAPVKDDGVEAVSREIIDGLTPNRAAADVDEVPSIQIEEPTPERAPVLLDEGDFKNRSGVGLQCQFRLYILKLTMYF